MTTKIMLDPGHGGKDPGAVTYGLQEKHLTLNIAKRIKRILETEYEGAMVYMTRTDDRYLSPDERVNMANQYEVNFFLSIHINAGWGTGFESFRYTNASSRSKALQSVIHPEIVAVLGTDVADRGAKAKNLHVLRETKMPALLTENLFIDNPADAEKLKDSAWLEKIARGHVNGLARSFGLKRKQGAAQPKQQARQAQKYRLMTGTFGNRDDAEKAAETLRKQFGWVVYVVDA